MSIRQAILAKKILLVEDNPHEETLTLRALGKTGLADHVAVVRDGEAALAYLFATGPFADRDLRDRPALVLLDLKLPKVDGLEVLERLRKDRRTRFLPVVVFSSSDERRDREESYRLGANSYVLKPVELDRYTEAIRQVGLYWLQLNEPPLLEGDRS